ncbi:MAG: PAS domain S-box protein [Dehalococcoidales bacterium]|jgi:PAS domain S-box-containing protein
MKVISKTAEQSIAELEWTNTRLDQTEQELRESEQFNASLLDNLPYVVVIVNPDTSIRYANPALERLTGFTLADVVGKMTPYPWWIWGKNPQNANKPANTQNDRVRTVEFYRKKNGETFWAEVTSVPVRFAGELQSYISSWIDVTEQKRAEKKVIEINMFYKGVLDNTVIGILVTNKNDIISYSNKSMGEITGIAPETLYGKVIFTCSLEKLVGYTRNHYVEAKKSLQSLYYQEIPAVTPEGQKIYQSGWLIPIIANGAFNGMIGTVEDTTERMRMEKRLSKYEELEKLKGELLAKVSHQLRTPLATIKGCSSLMLDYDLRLTDAEKRGYLQTIDNVTDQLTDLVSQLLDVSHLKAGMLKLKKESADIINLLEETIAEARLRATEHEIVNDLETWLPPMNIDIPRIKQVIENLIDNACKYSKDGTKIVISARKSGRKLLVSVADRGIGISEDDVEKVFNLMYRAEQVSSTNKPGLGLGLAICREIVEAHGGQIWVESQLGKGSIFYFSLPIPNQIPMRS